MPLYRSRKVFEIAKGLTAFLNVEAGIVRGDAPGGGQASGQGQRQMEGLRRRIGDLRERLSGRERSLREAQEELALKKRELGKLHLELAEKNNFSLRPGTFDEGVFLTVNMQNEYRLPESFEPDDVIVDIGTHIGSFCYAALRRGANRVHGFEAEAGNYACAARNLAPFGGRARLRNAAVWRSDKPVEKLTFTPSTDETNNAGGNVWSGSGEEVEAVAFDEVIREVTDGGARRVRLLKVDCEGSEFPILFTSRMLHLVDDIRGEFHEFGGEYDESPVPESMKIEGYGRFTMTELAEVLEGAGFSVSSYRHEGTRLGIFFASRESGSDGVKTGGA